jgi:integrase
MLRKVITEPIVAKLAARDRDYDVADLKERNLFLRVLPSGVMAWRVRLQTPEGRWYWWKLGDGKVTKPEVARVQARDAKARADKDEDLRETRRRRAKDAARTMTLRAFITDQYAPWVRTHQKRGEETLTTLANRCADFLTMPLPDITPFAVERWRSAYLKRKRKPATVNRVLTALKACLSKAVEWKTKTGLTEHPLKGLKLASVDRIGRLRFLTPDEEQRLLAALDARDARRRDAREHHNAWCRERGVDPWSEYGTYTDHLTPLVRTLLHTGLRFGEATGLTWGDVDLTGKLLTVRGETAKSARTRYVPLNKTALDTLKMWKPEHAAPTAYVFAGRKDGAKLVDIKTAWKQLLKSVKDAPITGFRVHDLRHTFASKLVQAGVDLNTVRELLGHADIKMTLRYAHLAPEHRAAAVAKVG